MFLVDGGYSMLRNLAIIAACGAVLMAPALPASASSAQPTAIEDFASSVTTVAYQQAVTFTGELVEAATNTPVANEPVQLEFQPGMGPYVVVASGTTDSDGEFTIATTLPSGGYVRAAFAGDTGLAPCFSNPSFGILLGPTSQLPSRLMLNSVPSSVSAGTQVTFSGTFQVLVNGNWQPFQGQPLELTMEPYISSQPNEVFETTSGTGGQFSLTETVSETSGWSVTTSLNGAYLLLWFPEYASSSYGWIDGVSKTRIVGFHIPAKIEAHRAFADGGPHATGTVQRWDGTSWVGLAYGSVQLYYRPEGSKRWRKFEEAQTGTLGQLLADVGVRLGTARWKATVVPAADTLTSTSKTVTSTITDRTHFHHVSIQRSSAGSSISGQVNDLFHGISFASLQGRTVRLYYRADGSKAWHAYRRTKVQVADYFYFFVPKSYGFQFKVVLRAQGPFLSSHSRTL